MEEWKQTLPLHVYAQFKQHTTCFRWHLSKFISLTLDGLSSLFTYALEECPPQK